MGNSGVILLFLNSIGTLEVIFILMVILMLFGSKSIPGLAKGLGKGIREIRDASNEIKRDIQSSALEMRKDLRVDENQDIEGEGGVDNTETEGENTTQKKDESTNSSGETEKTETRGQA